MAGHPALVEVFEHPDQLAHQWDALIDGLLASTLHVRRKATSTRRARAFLDRLTQRSLTDLSPAGAGVLGEAGDDLVSVRALDTGDGRTIHATALNIRHGPISSSPSLSLTHHRVLNQRVAQHAVALSRLLTRALDERRPGRRP